ncbi:hypothetical protein HX005_13555 [Acinetobacter sp. R933-2]|uniref:hypothetical protein n=1 Tax=Acinetobacter sp. R933-2 TaxID=2746728 RepID=UPI002575D110|nr:hypothetical protein [Acinetobacter sp. R933-2]MDM1248419.1 hypothetical protein [Acinetobacter sp. R933-2]
MFKNWIFVHFCWIVLVLALIQTEQKPITDEITTSQLETLNTAKQINVRTPTSERDESFSTTATTHTVSNAPISINQNQATEKKSLVNFKDIIADSELHYVGVYESNAREYTQTEQRQRKTECESQANNPHSSKVASDCWHYAYRAEKKNVEDTVTVHINSHRKVSLILTSYDPVKWVIQGNTQNLKLVYISGYHASNIVPRLSSSTKTYSNFYEATTCSFCLGSDIPYFYGYENSGDLQSKIQQYFKTPLTSFQGAYSAKNVYIN